MENERNAKRDWCQRHAERLSSDNNILGVGVGPKEVRGVPTDAMAVKFFLREKRVSGFVRGSGFRGRLVV